MSNKRVLFVCHPGRMRSRTAAEVFGALTRLDTDFAIKQILMLNNKYSRYPTAELDDLIHSMWPKATDAEIEQALRRDRAAIERRATFRLIQGEGNRDGAPDAGRNR